MARLCRVAVSIVLVALGSTVSTLAPANAALPGNVSAAARGTIGTVVTGASQFTVTGDTTLSMSVAQISGGQAHVVAGPGGSLPSAIKFPAYVSSGTYPRAVVRATPTSGEALDPGYADFEFGAVMRLNAVSSGRTEDNGDNVFQRGLFNEPSMFKLQLDGGRPSCFVRGASGLATVRSSVSVARGSWYTVRCSRAGGQLSIDVTAWGSSTKVRTSVWQASGNVSFPSSRAASIGGKLDSLGEIVSGASDQMNGAVAQVWSNRLG